MSKSVSPANKVNLNPRPLGESIHASLGVALLKVNVPFISRVAPGFAVPIPTFPLASTTNGLASLASSLMEKERPDPVFSIENFAYGEDEAIPILPLDMVVPVPSIPVP